MLSFIVSLTSWNNHSTHFAVGRAVVTCSHLLYLWLLGTTKCRDSLPIFALWLALIYCIFDFLEQLLVIIIWGHFCCDLLSFIVSLTSWNNRYVKNNPLDVVVTCSHLLYLWLLGTTEPTSVCSCCPLWLALIYCIFDFLEQPLLPCLVLFYRCDLLSFIVSLTSWNNWGHRQHSRQPVVTCSHLLYLWLLGTT